MVKGIQRYADNKALITPGVLLASFFGWFVVGINVGWALFAAINVASPLNVVARAVITAAAVLATIAQSFVIYRMLTSWVGMKEREDL